MGLGLAPASNIARRVIQKYRLSPPIDIETIIKEHARLSFVHIPFEGVDGISLNLKDPVNQTHVIVNKSRPFVRKRFTMAHEFGHILIPWHVGMIVDRVDLVDSRVATPYWEIEEEANSFAAELLMPHSWIEELIPNMRNLSAVQALIARECETSTLAAGIRLAQFAPSNSIFASERDGVVAFSGTTEDTIASPLEWGMSFPPNPFDYSQEHYTSTVGRDRLHWWVLPGRIHIDGVDQRSWRDILDGIFGDMDIEDREKAKLKSSISGIISVAISRCERIDDVDSIVTACIQRIKGRSNLESLVQHDDFEIFVLKRAEDLASRYG